MLLRDLGIGGFYIKEQNEALASKEIESSNQISGRDCLKFSESELVKQLIEVGAVTKSSFTNNFLEAFLYGSKEA